MQTTSLIGRRCTHSNVFSWPILIDRGLEPFRFSMRSINFLSFVLISLLYSVFCEHWGKKALSKFAPLAQLVEQLTLNQWVPGSNPWRCTIVSVINAKGPPVPIPNTEVKLCSAEDTCLETDRKNRSTLTQTSCVEIYSESVILTRRVHPFPFRTRKLSFAVPKILVWRRTGKIGHSRHNIKVALGCNLYDKFDSMAERHRFAIRLKNVKLVKVLIFLLSSVGRRPRKTTECCFSTGDCENKEFWSRAHASLRSAASLLCKHCTSANKTTIFSGVSMTEL